MALDLVIKACASKKTQFIITANKSSLGGGYQTNLGLFLIVPLEAEEKTNTEHHKTQYLVFKGMLFQ
jgi:hypothetical protein